MSGSQNSCETPKTSDDCKTNGGVAQENSDSAEHPSLLASRVMSVRKKKIVLHVDLNNTILVSDAVTKQGMVAALEYFLSTVTWGRMTKGEINTSCLLDTQLRNMTNMYKCIYQHCETIHFSGVSYCKFCL